MTEQQINIEENDLKTLFWEMQKQIIRQQKIIEQLKKEVLELAKKNNVESD
jgi:hypothetical protein